jgi:hypothetical protein
METTVVFEQKIALSPLEFNQLREKKLDDILLKKFAEENEGQCSVHGWVIPDTLKILSRSMLQIEGGRFTGDMVSWVQVEGKVIYPVDGQRLVGYVLKKNKMGMFVMYQQAIQIMVPRDLHIGNDEFDSVAIGEQVEVELKKSRFQVKDKTILSVGVFHRRVAAMKSLALPSRPVAEAADAEVADAEAAVAEAADAEAEALPALEEEEVDLEEGEEEAAATAEEEEQELEGESIDAELLGMGDDEE